jgi:hypothetical protein
LDLAFSFMPHSDHTSTDFLLFHSPGHSRIGTFSSDTINKPGKTRIHQRFMLYDLGTISGITFLFRSEGHSTVHQCPHRDCSTAFPSTESQHNREQSHGGRFRSVFQRYLSALIFRLVGGYAHNEVSKRCSPPILRCGQESRYKRGQEFAWNYAIVFQFIGEL